MREGVRGGGNCIATNPLDWERGLMLTIESWRRGGRHTDHLKGRKRIRGTEPDERGPPFRYLGMPLWSVKRVVAQGL